MSTGLLLITHGRLGRDMLDTVTTIMCQCPLQARAISIADNCNPDTEFATARDACRELDRGSGVLVMTDLFGSTPSNIAMRLLECCNTEVITGISVPMLLRVLNYPDAGLDKLAETAAEGAHNGVVISTRKQVS